MTPAYTYIPLEPGDNLWGSFEPDGNGGYQEVFVAGMVRYNPKIHGQMFRRVEAEEQPDGKEAQ